MKKNHWYAVKGQSLAIYARNAGFDLTITTRRFKTCFVSVQ